MLWVRGRFWIGEVLLIINLFNLVSLYFRHSTYPRLIHIPIVSAPLAWVYVAILWDGAAAVHARHLPARILANIAIWGILAVGGFYILAFKDYTMGFELAILSLCKLTAVVLRICTDYLKLWRSVRSVQQSWLCSGSLPSLSWVCSSSCRFWWAYLVCSGKTRTQGRVGLLKRIVNELLYSTINRPVLHRSHTKGVQRDCRLSVPKSRNALRRYACLAGMKRST